MTKTAVAAADRGRGVRIRSVSVGEGFAAWVEPHKEATVRVAEREIDARLAAHWVARDAGIWLSEEENDG